jgi:hypothetical protein
MGPWRERPERWQSIHVCGGLDDSLGGIGQGRDARGAPDCELSDLEASATAPHLKKERLGR